MLYAPCPMPSTSWTGKATENHDLVKVALVRKDFSPKGGGGERYAVELARALRDLGHEVHVFAHRYQPLKGLSFHPVSVPLKPFGLQNWIFAQNVRLALSKNGFDIINGLSQIYPQDIYRLGDGIHKHWLSARRPTSFSYLYDKVSPRHRLLLHLEKKIFSPENYKRIIANSELCKQHAIHYYKVPSQLVDVIYCGVDFAIFNSSVRNEGAHLRTSLGIGEEAIVVLFVGTNYARKGLETLLHAISRLKCREKYRLLVVGKGNIPRYQRLSQRLGLQEITIFCGFQEQMPPFYGAADIFVLPSYYDPFGNVCLEAMACGLPVITTRETGVSELMAHGKSGFILDHAQDTFALANWLEALEEAELRRSMGAEAQAQVAFLTIERNVKQTILAYEKVLENKT
jgi:UDP-glucose:(heptosyl)LPS alpha-1,3-glucosyltransferase